jgi:hypothetical protein
MPDTDRQQASGNSLGQRPGFDEWQDEVMSHLEARAATSGDTEPAPPLRRFPARTQKLFAWFTGERPAP